MMALLAKGLGWILGSKMLPLGLAGGLLIAVHQLWQGRDERIETAAVARCEAEHELARTRALLAAANSEAAARKAQLDDERKTTEDLRHERKAITQEFAAYKLAASSDPRCLSDSVLDLLRDGQLR
jgi:hypothetical protein